jgi:pilus assembly protein CpaE
VPAQSILLVESDPAGAEALAAILDPVGYELTVVAEAAAAFGQVVDHQLVILDVVGGKSALDLCQEIRSTPSMAAVPVLCITQTDDVEEKIHLLEAGADDVVAKPFDPRELEARVEALLLRFQRSKKLAPITTVGLASDGPRIVAVFSPKGGVGTTTIAVNVAMAAALRAPGRVGILDLDLQFGQAATHLNIQPRQTIADLVRDEQALSEPDLLRTYATAHGEGLQILASPGLPELAESVTPEHVEKILDTAPGTFDQIVVDAGSALDERTMHVLDAATTVIIPVLPEIADLKAVHSLIDYLTEAGSVPAKTSFVLNQLFARQIIKTRDVEANLGSRVSVELPYDPFLYLKAVNEGVPVVLGAPRTAPAQAMSRLADQVFPPAPTADGSAGPESGSRGGLLGALRRR